MKTQLIAGLFSGLALASAASAEGVKVYSGATITSNYIYTGISQTSGKATLQGYVEAEYGGFYLGVWASGADFPPDSLEIDGYVGYRGEAGRLSYDLSLTQVRYDTSGLWSNSVALELGLPVNDALTLSLRDSYDFTNKWNQVSLKAEYAATETVSFTALAGHDQGLGRNWGELGASLALSDTVSLGLTAQKNEFAPAVFAAAISFDTQVFGN
jgi:uncharacterized protein (TIGR02001 family)